MHFSKQDGFTLIELMITVAVVGILASIAYPSYVQYVVRANRSAAQSAMSAISNKQEQYLLDARQYASSVSALGYTVPAEVTSNYDISLACTLPTAGGAGGCTELAGPPTYLITGTPRGRQLAKDACGTLTLNSLGAKAPATGCW